MSETNPHLRSCERGMFYFILPPLFFIHSFLTEGEAVKSLDIHAMAFDLGRKLLLADHR